ncbi:MAG: hypothetical protein ABIN68_04760 [Sphingomicrobium sp.]
MRPITRYTLWTIAAAAIVAPAFAAEEHDLKLDDPKRDGTDTDGTDKGATRKGWDGTIKGPGKGVKGAAKFGAVGGMHRDDSIAALAATSAAAQSGVFIP